MSDLPMTALHCDSRAPIKTVPPSRSSQKEASCVARSKRLAERAVAEDDEQHTRGGEWSPMTLLADRWAHSKGHLGSSSHTETLRTKACLSSATREAVLF